MADVITQEALFLRDFILLHFPNFTVEVEKELKEIFPIPENTGLKHIWKYGSADIVVRKNGKIVLIVEPGGSHHFDEKQMKNDARKYKLCELNGAGCWHLMNSVCSCSNRKLKRILGKLLYGDV